MKRYINDKETDRQRVIRAKNNIIQSERKNNGWIGRIKRFGVRFRRYWKTQGFTYAATYVVVKPMIENLKRRLVIPRLVKKYKSKRGGYSEGGFAVRSASFGISQQVLTEYYNRTQTKGDE